MSNKVSVGDRGVQGAAAPGGARGVLVLFHLPAADGGDQRARLVEPGKLIRESGNLVSLQGTRGGQALFLGIRLRALLTLFLEEGLAEPSFPLGSSP
jgi:hypothetical protein